MLSFFLTLVILEREGVTGLIYGSTSIPSSHRHVLKLQWETKLASLFDHGRSICAQSCSRICLAANIQMLNLINWRQQLGRQIAQSVYGGIGHE